jgi:preprotein translocase subunit SecA
MDELKQSVQLACTRAKDPLLIYKLEAFNLFRAMIDNVNKVISFLFKVEICQLKKTNAFKAIDNSQVEDHHLTKMKLGSESANQSDANTATSS